jgi:hypothetical protein
MKQIQKKIRKYIGKENRTKELCKRKGSPAVHETFLTETLAVCLGTVPPSSSISPAVTIYVLFVSAGTRAHHFQEGGYEVGAGVQLDV